VPTDGLSMAVMLTGAVVALAGFGFLIGRVAEEIAAIAAVAGGVVLAAIPWLPAGPPPAQPVVVAEAPLVLSTSGSQTGKGQHQPGPPPPLPGREAARITVEASEAEPNDTLAGANVAAIGVSIDGTLTAGDRDWFAIDVPPRPRGVLVANLVTEDASVILTLLDDAGQTLGIAATLDEIRVRTATLERKLDSPRFYVLVTPSSDAAARYQLTVAARRR
jgi:hypothetical protein